MEHQCEIDRNQSGVDQYFDEQMKKGPFRNMHDWAPTSVLFNQFIGESFAHALKRKSGRFWLLSSNKPSSNGIENNFLKPLATGKFP
jgi:hypothetical protein